MKKISSLILVIITIFLVTGCQKSSVTVSGEKVKTGKMQHKHCTRAAQAGDGVSVDLEYEIYYTDDLLNVLESNEMIKTDDKSTLDQYENAYKNINKNYEDLKYYDSEVKRTENSVLRKTTINYDKIDIDKLIEIEGADDNIIEDRKANVNKWLSLAKKFGTKCEEVEK